MPGQAFHVSGLSRAAFQKGQSAAVVQAHDHLGRQASAQDRFSARSAHLDRTGFPSVAYAHERGPLCETKPSQAGGEAGIGNFTENQGNAYGRFGEGNQHGDGSLLGTGRLDAPFSRGREAARAAYPRMPTVLALCMRAAAKERRMISPARAT